MVHISDATPGIRRTRSGKGFKYVYPNGRVASKADIQRAKSLVIPPAWTDVWISPLADSHLQATGRDAKNRKQYRYHARWRAKRDETKHEHIVEFASALPAIRARLAHDLKLEGMPREKVLATVVKLLEATLVRVGNEEYAKSNDTYGLTTLRNKHVNVSGARIRFNFKGKGSKPFSISLEDKRLAAIVRRSKDLPGQALFEYKNGDGSIHGVSSSDVNAYIKEASGSDFTAKDFRTWAATVLAASKLRALEFETEQEAQSQVVDVIKDVADTLGNTPAVCRKCYINPIVVKSFLDGSLRTRLQPAKRVKGLNKPEAMVLKWLKNGKTTSGVRK
jgi:DNA topoisomerase-1